MPGLLANGVTPKGFMYQGQPVKGIVAGGQVLWRQPSGWVGALDPIPFVPLVAFGNQQLFAVTGDDNLDGRVDSTSNTIGYTDNLFSGSEWDSATGIQPVVNDAFSFSYNTGSRTSTTITDSDTAASYRAVFENTLNGEVSCLQSICIKKKASGEPTCKINLWADTSYTYTKDAIVIVDLYSGLYTLTSSYGGYVREMISVIDNGDGYWKITLAIIPDVNNTRRRLYIDPTFNSDYTSTTSDGSLIGTIEYKDIEYTAYNNGIMYASKWYDQSGNNNHALQATGASQPIVNRGGGLSFDGVDDHLKVTCDFIGSQSGIFNVKFNSYATEQVVWGRSGYGSFLKYVDANDTLYIQLGTTDGSFPFASIPNFSTIYPAGTIVQIGYVYDELNEMKIYVDGELKNTKSITGLKKYDFAYMTLGSGDGGISRQLNGVIYEGVVYKEVLTDTHFLNSYNQFQANKP